MMGVSQLRIRQAGTHSNVKKEKFAYDSLLKNFYTKFAVKSPSGFVDVKVHPLGMGGYYVGVSGSYSMISGKPSYHLD